MVAENSGVFNRKNTVVFSLQHRYFTIASYSIANDLWGMKKILICCCFILWVHSDLMAWGFYAHRLINKHAVFLLPPEMIVFFKPHIGYLEERATAPDSRRYMVQEEGPRHYIDLDHYGTYPFDSLPRKWTAASEKFGQDILNAHGIVPWWIQTMLARLTKAFSNKDPVNILKTAAELGHYIADAHVPLHTSSNHNGQKTNQHGIHAFWESRIPELLAETEWDLLTGKGFYIEDPFRFTWQFVLESAGAADSVLNLEALLNRSFPQERKFAFEFRNGQLIKQYSSDYSIQYNKSLNGMVERRLRSSIHAVASFWITAWTEAGQPDLSMLEKPAWSEAERKEMETLQAFWKTPLAGAGCH
ncbi:zinc dependent phospholipase C family protein [Parasegetibacter sp. NRK P23]|uniref:zinc dependent phospholipase C family protein n=1 Tax=Parasegetibacter sp. NRK P23 TaxID=2942999 RepID=UPI00204383EA|nr:zinc dependent phospholipase C family protein [Parasegetibacter sp. NRK P23]MCM5530551.1 zinc dependent phospholipase C family protein [Parasegetibacter sp. NRK P23]